MLGHTECFILGSCWVRMSSRSSCQSSPNFQQLYLINAHHAAPHLTSKCTFHACAILFISSGTLLANVPDILVDWLLIFSQLSTAVADWRTQCSSPSLTVMLFLCSFHSFGFLSALCWRMHQMRLKTTHCMYLKRMNWSSSFLMLKCAFVGTIKRACMRFTKARLVGRTQCSILGAVVGLPVVDNQIILWTHTISSCKALPHSFNTLSSCCSSACSSPSWPKSPWCYEKVEIVTNTIKIALKNYTPSNQAHQQQVTEDR